MLNPCPGNSSWSARGLERSHLLSGLWDNPCHCSPAPGMQESCSVLSSLHCHGLGSAVLWQGWLFQRRGRRRGGEREGRAACWQAWTAFLWGCQPGSARWAIHSLWVAGADPCPGHGLGFRGLTPAEAPEPRQGCAGQSQPCDVATTALPLFREHTFLPGTRLLLLLSFGSFKAERKPRVSLWLLRMVAQSSGKYFHQLCFQSDALRIFPHPASKLTCWEISCSVQLEFETPSKV